MSFISFMNTGLRALSLATRTVNQSKRLSNTEDSKAMAKRKERIAIIKGLQPSAERDRLLLEALSEL